MSAHSPPAGFQRLTTHGAFLSRVGQIFIREAGVDTRAALATRVEREQSNSEGFAHGGFLLTFANVALSLATDSDLLSVSAEFLRPARLSSWIVAEVHVQKASRSLIFADATVTTGDSVILQAHGLYRPRESRAPR